MNNNIIQHIMSQGEMNGFKGSTDIHHGPDTTKDSPIDKRVSVREFLPTAIDKKDLESIVDAGTRAPSSKNRQPWKIWVLGHEKASQMIELMTAEISKMISECNIDVLRNDLVSALRTMEIMRQVPNIVVVGYVDRRPYRYVKEIGDGITDRQVVDVLSIGACVENMVLRATELGIDSLWIGDHLYATEALNGMPWTEGRIIAMIAFGYRRQQDVKRSDRHDDRVIWL